MVCPSTSGYRARSWRPLPCNYLREPHACLADHGYRVIAYDQLGCGASDRSDDASLRTIQRYANRIPDLQRITVPALITVGKHDEITPACALRMKNALPDSELAVFPNSSHMPFY